MSANIGFSARAGTRIVTPGVAGQLAGYVARGSNISEGIHDDLEVSMVWLSDVDSSVVWLAIDVIGVTGPLHESLAAAVHTELGDEVLVLTCASHTHSGPLGWSGSIHPGNPGVRSDAAVDELVQAVRELAASLRESPAEGVWLGWSEGTVSGVGTNRLAPTGPHDSTAGVLSIRRLSDGTLLAVVVDFATHPTVLSASNLLWSGDWPAAARQILRAALGAQYRFSGSDVGAPAPVITFLQGAAGDVSTRFTRRSQDFSEAARIGAIFAAEVLGQVDRSSERCASPTADVLRHTTFSVRLPVRSLPDPASATASVVENELALSSIAATASTPELRLVQTRLDGARVQRDLAAAAPSSSIDVPVEVVAIGTLAWVHVPVELFASLGLRLRANSPFAHTRVVGYTNGYLGYLADRAAHDAHSYEALSSYFSAESADEFVGAVVGILKDFASAPYTDNITSKDRTP